MALKTGTSSNGGRRGESGFTLLQIVLTIAIMAIVTSFAVVQIAVSRDHMTLTSATREFAGYAEKARLDSVRRHGDGTVAVAASVKLDSASGYSANFDYTYDGALDTRSFDL